MWDTNPRTFEKWAASPDATEPRRNKAVVGRALLQHSAALLRRREEEGGGGGEKRTQNYGRPITNHQQSKRPPSLLGGWKQLRRLNVSLSCRPVSQRGQYLLQDLQAKYIVNIVHKQMTTASGGASAAPPPGGSGGGGGGGKVALGTIHLGRPNHMYRLAHMVMEEFLLTSNLQFRFSISL